MTFIGLKILLVCKETFSYPLFYLGEKWKKDNEVAAFFFNPVECVYNKSTLNASTYYWFKEHGYKVFDSKDIAMEFAAMDNSKINDPDYLNYIRENYTQFRSVNLQFMFSQYLTRHFHFRNYMRDSTQEEQVNWLCLNYRNIEKILDEYRPDVIIDTDNAELARIVLLETSYKRNIPYITLEFPRYETYKTCSYQLGIGIDPYFIDAYEKALSGNEPKDEEIEYIRNFREKKNIMSVEYQNTIDSKYSPDPVILIMKRLTGIFLYFYRQNISAGNLAVKKTKSIIFPSTLEYLKFYWRVEWTRRKLLSSNHVFEAPVAGEKYVYMPLHLIPESTTFVKAPFFINELSIIEAVSKALPPTWKLYVKEHQAMLGERTLDFYDAVKKIPNVRLVQLNYYTDPKPWITNCMGVVTITGTTAFEAALLSKRAVVFGDVMFGLIKGVTKVADIEQLPELIEEFETPLDNVDSCAAYIQAVRKTGVPVNFNDLMLKCERMIKYNEPADELFETELGNLEKLFYIAYDRWLEQKDKGI